MAGGRREVGRWHPLLIDSPARRRASIQGQLLCAVDEFMAFHRPDVVAFDVEPGDEVQYFRRSSMPPFSRF